MSASENDDRFRDRLEAATFRNDPKIHFGLEQRGQEPVDWVEIPERLVSRLTSLGDAYELNVVPNIDIYADTVFNSHQCEKLHAELGFLAGLIPDPALQEVLASLTALTGETLGTSRRLHVSGN
jgi:hypothetical protein